MKKTFVAKVIEEGVVDTQKYRYRTECLSTLHNQYLLIKRLPLALLDTTASLAEWEIVYDERQKKKKVVDLIDAITNLGFSASSVLNSIDACLDGAGRKRKPLENETIDALVFDTILFTYECEKEENEFFDELFGGK